MKKTNKNLASIIGITDLARPHHQQIGNYIEHFENDNLKYEVILTDNGAITISVELAQDFAVNPTNINEPRIIQVANSYRKIK
ncbi:hypothetical protein [Flavobacterium sp.]|jgi:hypothetical protein|uniref:hypothetical protein n=1 Tax=Flavobacterium sp. TaxID=239 RepID=UPI0037C091FA